MGHARCTKSDEGYGLEVKHTFHKIKTFQSRLTSVAEGIRTSNIPDSVYTNFFESQKRFNEKNIQERSNRTKRKFQNIIVRNPHQISCTELPTHNSKAIHNGTQVVVPPEAEVLLSLGPKFALPVTAADRVPFLHLMADVEQIIKTNPIPEVQDRNRCAVANIITNYIHGSRNRSAPVDPVAKFCENAQAVTRSFLKDNPNVYVVRSDKGNKTVLMESEDYKKKMLELLQDRTTYAPIPRDPTSRYERLNNNIVRRIRNLDIIDDRTAKQLTRYNAVCPRIYGQPKAHKPGLPLRPVVPNITAPSYNLSKFIGKIFQQSLVSTYNIKDSFSFCQFINNVTLPENYVLISLDVKSLFTSIPKSLAISSIISRWDEIRPNTGICLDLFLEIVEFCIDASYFKFDGQHYQQIFGTAMGNPLSPAIADWVMETLLDTVVRMLNIPLPFLRKFVDDLITAIPISELQHVLDTFNSYDVHIQFTYELEVDNKLPFLDMLLTRHSNQKVTTQWYQKPIASGRFLNFRSYHPLSQKLNMAKNFARRVYQLSTDLDDREKAKIIDAQLQLNDYPKPLRHRIANRMNEHVDDHQQQPQNLEYTYRRIPYITHLSNRIDRVLQRDYGSIRLAKYNVRSTRELFTMVKDPVPPEQQSNVVYIIPCSNCEATYVGMTTNRLKTRIYGHQTHYNTLEKLLEQGSDANDPQIVALGEKTALMNHSINKQHRFDLKKVKILDKNVNAHTLQFLEMGHIASNKNCVNKRTDTEGLHAIYAGIIYEIGNINKIRNRHDTQEHTHTTTQNSR
ncbi:uncharacterized protein LOC134288736 [Aedes albopictus]|uniref:Reverse transcriptase domain-containing protein n=1 Tax=Aedes albopictus TaxID=7160 RepID=A0ABM1ZYE6_AEDAL